MLSRLSDQNIDDPIIRSVMYRELLVSDKTDWVSHAIAVDEEYRPDLVSHRIYKTVDCRWVVLLIAGLTDELEALPVGVTSSYPPSYLIRKYIKAHGV
jgi:hypothetical protein